MQSFVALCVKKALRIFRELIPRRTTRVAFWDPLSRSKNICAALAIKILYIPVCEGNVFCVPCVLCSGRKRTICVTWSSISTDVCGMIR